MNSPYKLCPSVLKDVEKRTSAILKWNSVQWARQTITKKNFYFREYHTIHQVKFNSVFSLPHILFARKHINCVIYKYSWHQHCFNGMPEMVMFTLLLDSYPNLSEDKTVPYRCFLNDTAHTKLKLTPLLKHGSMKYCNNELK